MSNVTEYCSVAHEAVQGCESLNAVRFPVYTYRLVLVFRTHIITVSVVVHRDPTACLTDMHCILCMQFEDSIQQIDGRMVWSIIVASGTFGSDLSVARSLTQVWFAVEQSDAEEL